MSLTFLSLSGVFWDQTWAEAGVLRSPNSDLLLRVWSKITSGVPKDPKRKMC